MRILLTNDDGVDAPGIAALHRDLINFTSAHDINAEVIVVAPDRVRSECGHSVTTRETLRVREVREGWFCTNGTPVDCVRIALTCLCPDATVVFSGINAGANVGIDLNVSGTFAAAKEAAIQGRPAIAISHYRHPNVPKTWEHTGKWLDEVMSRFFKQAPTADAPSLWNVNLPAIDPATDVIPQTRFCDVDRSPLVRTGRLSDTMQVEMASDFHGRPRDEGTDVDLCFTGSLTVSELDPFSI